MNSEQNESSDGRSQQLAGDIAGLAIVLGIIAIVVLALPDVPERVIPPPAPAAVNALPAPPAMSDCTITGNGYLRGRLYGALDQEIAWQGEDLLCDGRPRPDGDGLRLFFEDATRDDGIAIVIGIDGRPGRLAGREHAANITIIDENRSRFFSAGGRDRCWTTIENATALGESTWRIEGVFYCAGALPSLADNSSVTLDEFSYAGRLNMIAD